VQDSTLLKLVTEYCTNQTQELRTR